MGIARTMTLAAACLASTAACGEDREEARSAAGLTDTELAEQTIDTLKECDVYTPAQYPEDDTVRDEFDRCAARCLIEESTCEKLQTISCGRELANIDPFVTCIRQCPSEPADGFDCRYGERVPWYAVCDGIRDCGKAEDEQGCKPYVCADGEEIEGKDLRCDSFADCADGSDEEDCPFSC